MGNHLFEILCYHVFKIDIKTIQVQDRSCCQDKPTVKVSLNHWADSFACPAQRVFPSFLCLRMETDPVAETLRFNFYFKYRTVDKVLRLNNSKCRQLCTKAKTS